MHLTQAIEGFVYSRLADGYAPITLRGYRSSLGTLAEWLEDLEVDTITPAQLKDFMGYLHTDYQPERKSGSQEPLSTASFHRYCKALRSFFKWAEADLHISRPDLDLKRPQYTNREKLDTKGPVLYRQERVGKWGRTFACCKFRSMYVDADARKSDLLALNEADEIVFKIRNDPRVTRVGHIIRKLSIDELPQIFNVIKGDMSIVGPRPPVPVEVEQYRYEYFSRLEAVPGITGLQQVSGRSDVAFKRWIELDLQYIEEQSLLKDIEIMLRTIPTVISGKGAY